MMNLVLDIVVIILLIIAIIFVEYSSKTRDINKKIVENIANVECTFRETSRKGDEKYLEVINATYQDLPFICKLFYKRKDIALDVQEIIEDMERYATKGEKEL